VSDIDIHHLGAAYVLDALDDRERAAFEAHYASCEVCHADVVDFQGAVASLAASSATAPPHALKAKVMGEVAATRQVSPLLPDVVVDLADRRRRNRRWLTSAVGAAAAIVAFFAGALVFGGGGQSQYAQALDHVLSQRDARFIELAGTDAVPDGGVVRVAWSDQIDTAVLVADDLPEAPAGRAYELWSIGADGPVAMGVLDRASDGRLREVLALGAAPDAWGMTIEPAAGSPVPTGDILYLGDA
jgi:anti-sigma-K factor RskA